MLERVIPVSTSSSPEGMTKPAEKPVAKPIIRNTTPKMKVYPVKESPPLIELRSIFA